MGDITASYRRGLARIGLLLVLLGCGYIVTLFLKNEWIPIIILLIFMGTNTAFALHSNRLLDLMVNLFGFVAGLGCLFFLTPVIGQSIAMKVGATILSSGIAFFLLEGFFYLRMRKISGWAFFIGWAISFLSVPFLEGDLVVLKFVLWGSMGIGGGLVLWGLAKRLLGLIIAGCLVSSMGFGIYSAWNQAISPNGLTETGIMLVWFGLGWGFITILSRLRLSKNLGWPLIPAGILGVVGWGLYSGGDPNNALSFIGNTGSLGVMIFGLYFLLMRRGIRR